MNALQSVFANRSENLHLALVEMFRNPMRHSELEFRSHLFDSICALADTEMKVTSDDIADYLLLLVEIDRNAGAHFGINLHWVIRALYIDRLDQLREVPSIETREANVLSVNFGKAKPIHL